MKNKFPEANLVIVNETSNIVAEILFSEKASIKCECVILLITGSLLKKHLYTIILQCDVWDCDMYDV